MTSAILGQCSKKCHFIYVTFKDSFDLSEKLGLYREEKFCLFTSYKSTWQSFD